MSYNLLISLSVFACSSDALAAFSSEPTNTFATPNYTTTPTGYPTAPQRNSTLPVGAGSGPNSSPTLQTLTISSKTASKKSPKLWPKRSANVMPINTPAPPMGEWSGVCSGTKEDFSKLHEDFGKEVKELIASWSKRGQAGEAAAEENLIDFGW